MRVFKACLLYTWLWRILYLTDQHTFAFRHDFLIGPARHKCLHYHRQQFQQLYLQCI